MRPQRNFLSRQSISTQLSAAATARAPCISCKRLRFTKSWTCQPRNARPKPWPAGRSRSMAPMRKPVHASAGPCKRVARLTVRWRRSSELLSIDSKSSDRAWPQRRNAYLRGTAEGRARGSRNVYRLDPRDPYLAVRLLHIACGLYFCSEYQASIEASKRLIRSYPDFPDDLPLVRGGAGPA